ncbi:hypothetical protein U8260_32435 [Nocardia sp. CDC192]|nr:hypothetical protein [Nocardia sp. CDC192]MEA3532965.1 hypothetical protein [Nocardia sp. CDC192]
MSINSIAAAVEGSGWTVFWMQLPVLLLAVAIIIVATTALRRARPEDVPKVFEAFAAAFGRSTGRTRRRAVQEPQEAEDGIE